MDEMTGAYSCSADARRQSRQQLPGENVKDILTCTAEEAMEDARGRQGQ